MDANDFSYEDEMDAAIVGALSACVGVLEIVVDNCDNSGEDSESIPRIPSSTRNEMRRKYVQSIIGVDDATSIKMIRMNRRTFYQLYVVVQQRNLLHDTIHVTVHEQLLMFLHTIAHNVRNGVMCVNYLRSGETISRYFNHVLKALRQLHNDYIRPPDTAISDEIRSREIYWPWFKDCVGAIDGTHILASVPSDIVARFRGKAGKPTQNVLAAVRFDLTFSYVLAGWEGSAHDVLVLNDALQRQNRLIVPNGKYFLVDAGYSTRPGFISPYRGVRYHLKHFGEHTPTNKKELFNLRHSSLRTTVERAFGLLKRRFRIINEAPCYPFPTQVEIVLVCCILHNFILGLNPNDELLNEIDVEESIQLTSRRKTRREEREDNVMWASIRDEIANEMWNDYSK